MRRRRSRGLWMPLLVLSLASVQVSCSDSGLSSATLRGTTLADLMISTSPAVLDYGHVEVGSEKELEVTVSNIGTRTLTLKSVGIDRTSHFAVGSLPVSALEPGQSIVIPVRYQPTGYEAATANLVITSNDPLLPSATVGLAGRCDPPRLSLSPPIYDFGIAYIGCKSVQALYLENIGDGTLEVTSLDFSASSSDLTLDSSGLTLPLELAPGGKIQLETTYAPDDEGEDTATVKIASNDPETPLFEGSLMGTGKEAGLITDVFNVDDNGKVDILFVVDNSYSMADNQTTLAANFENFYYIIESLELDWQIGVVTTDNGVLQGTTRIITPATPDVQETFSDNALVGVYGSGWEQGLEYAYQALSDPLVNAQNRGFLRDDAGLRIIILSDEEDRSLKSVDYYVSYFQSLKVNPSLVQISAITGGRSGCSTDCGYADVANYDADAVEATGGIQASICECDFIEALEGLAESSQVFQDTFPLTQDPVVETLEVHVDDTLSTDWYYDSALNSVVFNSAEVTPQNGETVTVSYQLSLDCSD